MSLTVTVRSETIRLVRKPTFDAKVDELYAILDRYSTWEDPLSDRLFKWSNKLITQISYEAIQTEEGVTAANQMLEKLFRKILVNPLQPDRSLENPVLERDRVWEKAEIESWRALTHMSPDPAHHDRSPYDIALQREGRMGPEAPHSFAIDIMKWSRSLQTTQEMTPPEAMGLQTETPNPLALVQATNQGQSLVPATETPSYIMIALKISSFIQLAQQVIFRETMAKGREAIRQTAQETRRLLEETRQAVRAQQEAFARGLEAHQRQVEERIEEIEHVHQLQVNAIEGEIEVEREKQRQQQISLDAARAQNEVHVNEIHQLRIAYQARLREIEQIRQNARRGGCILF